MVSTTVSTLAFGGPAGEVVLGAELSPAHATPAISDKPAAIQSKRNPPGIKAPRKIHRQAGPPDRVSKTAPLSFEPAGLDVNMNGDVSPTMRPATLLSSSMAEHPAVNRGVV